MPHDYGNPHLKYLGFKQGTCNYLFHHGNPHLMYLGFKQGNCNFCFHATHGETPMYLDWKQKPVTFASTTRDCHVFRLENRNLKPFCFHACENPYFVYSGFEKGNLQFCFQLHTCEKPPSHIFRLEKGNLLPCHTTVRNPHLMLLGLKTRNL